MAYQQWSVVYGEQPSASKWNILGTNDAHFYSFLGDNEAWQSYTPSFLNFTAGASTVEAKYIQIGKTVRASAVVTLGAGFSFSGSLRISNPVSAISDYTASGYGSVGYLRVRDVSPGTSYWGSVRIIDSTYAAPTLYNTTLASYTVAQTLATGVPITWANTDYFALEWEYEAV